MVFIPIAGSELLKALEFPKCESIESVFCYVTVNFWKAPKNGRREGMEVEWLMADDLNSHVHVVKPNRTRFGKLPSQ